MSYVKPIDKEKIIVNEKYWTCSYTGRIRVTVIKILGNSKVLVKTKNGNPFIREMRWIFDDEELCKRAGRQWEHDERKRKKGKKKAKAKNDKCNKVGGDKK